MSIPDRIPPDEMLAADLEQLIRDVEGLSNFSLAAKTASVCTAYSAMMPTISK